MSAVTSAQEDPKLFSRTRKVVLVVGLTLSLGLFILMRHAAVRYQGPVMYTAWCGNPAWLKWLSCGGKWTHWSTLKCAECQLN